MGESITAKKSFAFAVRIVKLYQHLTKEKKEYVLSKQVLRSGTGIGANVSEAQRGQSRADFHAKMTIALKEANETSYWIELLYHTDYITTAEYESLHEDVDELLRLLTAICKTSAEEK